MLKKNLLLLLVVILFAQKNLRSVSLSSMQRRQHGRQRSRRRPRPAGGPVDSVCTPLRTARPRSSGIPQEDCPFAPVVVSLESADCPCMLALGRTGTHAAVRTQRARRRTSTCCLATHPGGRRPHFALAWHSSRSILAATCIGLAQRSARRDGTGR